MNIERHGTKPTAKHEFESSYFTRDSAYARHAPGASALKSIGRWYEGLLRDVEKFIGPFSGRKVLDLGCGYGGLVLALTERGAHCTGVDVSSFTTEVNRKALAEATFVIGNLEQELPTPTGHYDVTFCLEVLEHLQDPDAAVEKIIASTRRGGYFVLTTPNRDGRVPCYRYDSDPTHINVRGFTAWRELVLQRGGVIIHADTYLTIPFIWRYHHVLSRRVRLRDFGPGCLIVGRRPE